MIKQIILLTIIAVILGNCDTCGGNCPSDDCPVCWCGQQKNMVDITDTCSKYSWNQACCKCIISHQSGANANAMSYDKTKSWWIVGLFQLSHYYVSDYCYNRQEEIPCSVSENVKCAVSIYNYGRWSSWDSAKACGC